MEPCGIRWLWGQEYQTIIKEEEENVMKRDPVYVQLQKHLDKQPVGYPATWSGSEIEILKHIFSPLDAQIALGMSYRFDTAADIMKRLSDVNLSISSVEELEGSLDDLFKKGGILSRVTDGVRYYALAPLVVGMYELQNHRLTPDFIKHFKKYTKDKRFGVEFLSTEMPQMRTIPIAESISNTRHVSPFDEVVSLIANAKEPFAILECICRKKKELEGQTCKVTDRKETCLAMADMAEGALHIGIGRAISREEALDIIGQNQKEGLVLQPGNSQGADFICSCCGCCCGILDIHHMLPRPLDYWAANFHATVDGALCNGCGVCEKRCQVGAVHVKEKGAVAKVDLNLCLGCGVCVTTCPKQSITLEKNAREIKPPQTVEELYDTIMEKKKGSLGKLKIMAKLGIDAVRSGRFDVLFK